MTIIQVNVQPLKKFKLCVPHLNNPIKMHWVKVEHPQHLRKICAISYWNSMMDFKKIVKFPQKRFLYFIAWIPKVQNLPASPIVLNCRKTGNFHYRFGGINACAC